MANESDAPNRTEVMAFQVHQDRSLAPPPVQGAEVNQAVGGVLVVQFFIDTRMREVSRSTRTEDGEIESEYESVRPHQACRGLLSQSSRLLPPRKSWRGSCYVR